ncbi:MAG: DEAD/DEAH box helicase [Candidatus Hydrogenedentes bacterium]|nr:DEAD/DEAH box helicase [Candidatus Hydrogenedentota bacterium]
MNVTIRALIDFIASADTRTNKKAAYYARQGRVKSIEITDDSQILATVLGSGNRLYETLLTVTLSRSKKVHIDSECSCPVGFFCKHAVAVAIEIIDGSMNAELTDEFAGELSGLRPASTRASRYKPWWEKFLDAKTETTRREQLVSGLGESFPHYASSWPIYSAADALIKKYSPMEVLDFVEDTVRSLSMRLHGAQPINPGFLEYLNAPERREASETARRARDDAAFYQWLNGDGANSVAGLSQLHVEWHTAQVGTEFSVFACRILLSGSKLDRSPRHPQAIEQLQRELDSGARRLAPLESSFLNWLLRQRDFDAVRRRSPFGDERFVIPILEPMLWLTRWASCPFFSWPDGSRVIVSPHGATISTMATSGGKRVWSIAFTRENGAQEVRPLKDVEFIADAEDQHLSQRENAMCFALEGNVIYPIRDNAMPLHILAALRTMEEVPLEQLREKGVGPALIARMPALAVDPSTVAQIPVVPRVELRLGQDNFLAVNVSAVAVDGTAFAWSQDGLWRQRKGAISDAGEAMEEIAATSEQENAEEKTGPEFDQQAIENALCIVPRPEDVAPIETWVRALFAGQFGALKIAGAGEFTRRLSNADLARISALWLQRPSGVTYLGNDVFRSAVTLRRPPRMQLKVEPSGTDWLQVSVDMERDIEQLSWSEVEAALDSPHSELVALPGGRLYRRSEIETYRNQLETLANLGIGAGDTQRIHAMQFASQAPGAVAELTATAGFRELGEALRGLLKKFKGVPRAKVAKKTSGHLRPYQRTGTDFLVWAAQTFGGALLADDMGLGKTLQVLAALTALRATAAEKRPSLVVCPASVMSNWQREAERFAPSLRTLVLERGKGRRDQYDTLDEYDLVIKNFALTRRDADLLRAREWLMVCVDEAQAIKNPGSEIARTVKSLNAGHRIALTGTPIENRLTDLWSIIDFAVPSYLSAQRVFEARAKSGNAAQHAQALRARLRPVVLRRLKSEVAPELPPRIEERRECVMTSGQRTAYLAEVKKTRLLLEGTKTDAISGKERFQVLAALMRLRQICCDPALIGLSGLGSGKVDELMDLLPPLLEAGQKILLFSQFVKMIERLEPELRRRGIKTFKLTGATTKRQALVDAFEMDAEPSVFLISLKAGGTGLNLVSASHVVLFDPWWNPAVEAQAIDRTHRIGQDKTVVAVRLITQDTIEQRIAELQERKSAIARDVFNEDSFNRQLTRSDLDFLLQSD